MTTYLERFSSHAVFKSLGGFEASIGKAEEKAKGKDKAPARDGLGRLRHVKDRIEQVLSRVDPLVVSPRSLTGIQGGLDAAISELDQFSTNGQDPHVNAANDQVDRTVLPTLGALILLIGPEDVEGVQSAMRTLHENSTKLVGELQRETEDSTAKVQSLQGELGTLAEAIKAEKVRTDAIVSQHQQHFSDAQDKRQQDFDTAETAREEKTATKLGEWEGKFAELENTQGEKFTELSTSLQDEASKLLVNIEARKDEAKKIVGIIAGTGMAGGYMKDADAERRVMYFWIGTALVGFLGLIGFAVSTFVATTAEQEFDWPDLLARLLAVAAFGWLAAFAGRMAMKHRDSERQHRHKQLALESVNPFLEDLTSDDQKEIKKEIARAFFARTETQGDEDLDVAPTTIDSLIKLLTALQKLK